MIKLVAVDDGALVACLTAVGLTMGGAIAGCAGFVLAATRVAARAGIDLEIFGNGSKLSRSTRSSC